VRNTFIHDVTVTSGSSLNVIMEGKGESEGGGGWWWEGGLWLRMSGKCGQLSQRQQPGQHAT
jgi:hypothetical protein